MAEVVRVAALTGFFAAMEALGADPAPLLREAGLSRKLLSSPEQTTDGQKRLVGAQGAAHGEAHRDEADGPEVLLAVFFHGTLR